MPLVSALAASHAPNILLEPGREWEDFMDLHYSMAPQGSAKRPTFEQQKKLRQDAEAAFAVLRTDLEAAKPDVLIVVANDQFVTSVEIVPPKGCDPSKMIEGVRSLKEAGVDAVNVPDGPRAQSRMGALSVSLIIQQQVGIEAIESNEIFGGCARADRARILARGNVCFGGLPRK